MDGVGVMAYRGSSPVLGASAYHFGLGGAPGNALTRGRRQDRQETPAQRIARLRREENQRRMQSMSPNPLPQYGSPGFGSAVSDRLRGQVAPDRGFAGPGLGQSPYGADRRLNPVQAAAFGNSDMGRIFQQARDGAPGGMPGGTPMGGQQPFVPTEPSFGQRFGGPLGDAGVAATRAATTSPTNPAPSFIQSLTEGLGQFTKSFTENERYLAEKGIQEEERFKADQFRDYQMELGRAGEGRAVEEHELTIEAYEDKQEAQRRIATIFKGLGENPTNEQIFQALQKAVNEAYAAGDTGIAQAINTNMELYTTDQGDRFTAPYDMYDREGNSYRVMTDKQTLETYQNKDGQLVRLDTSRMQESPFTGGTTGTTQRESLDAGLLKPAIDSEIRIRRGNLDFTMSGGSKQEGYDNIAAYEANRAQIELAEAALERAQESGDEEAIVSAQSTLSLTIGPQGIDAGPAQSLPTGYLESKEAFDAATRRLDAAYEIGEENIIVNAENEYYDAEEAFYKTQFKNVEPLTPAFWKGFGAELINQNQGQSAGLGMRFFKALVQAEWGQDPAFADALAGYTNALSYINPIVRFLSGAQMTNQEAMRYYQALIPVPGEPISIVLLKRRKRSVLMDAMGDNGLARQERALDRLGYQSGDSISFDPAIYGEATPGVRGNPSASAHMNRILNSLDQVVGDTESGRIAQAIGQGAELGAAEVRTGVRARQNTAGATYPPVKNY